MGIFRKAKAHLTKKRLVRQIRALEIKRSRSMSSLITSILDKTPVSEEDKKYFDEYTEQIDSLREELKKIEDDL